MATSSRYVTVRKFHRWLGFFLAGIMLIYACSGILLIFRDTGFLKYQQTVTVQLEKSLDQNQLADALKIRGFQFRTKQNDMILFKQGSYNVVTGQATYQKKGYPAVLESLVRLHKANTRSPLFILNIGFGLALAFFVISAFLMFMPKTALFRQGLKIATAGALFAFIVVVFSS